MVKASNKKLNILFIFILIASALLLSTDGGLKYFDKDGLCTTDDCKFVADYLRIDETTLILCGALFFWVMSILAIVSLKWKKEIFWHGITVALLGSLAFDGGLLGFQYAHIGTRCLLCIGVGISLCLTLFIFSMVRRSVLILLFGLVVFATPLGAQYLIQLNLTAPPIQKTVFMRLEVDKEPYPQYYYYFSMHCPHCAEVIASIAINYPLPVNWNFCCLAKEDNDILKLVYIYQETLKGKNPFMEILRAEKAKEINIEGDLVVPEGISQSVQYVKRFFISHGYTGVPMLIIEEDARNQRIIRGAESILRELTARGFLKRKLRSNKPDAH